ncbi:MAG: hypothetical protein K9L98_00050 [Candidatus Pacebacteria bacterium]|nr:hypothetical protein [Candidatus Paceibacterota bacterium]MCF7862395.1 hypothetical protein [Candidatus Paceibacterota bacterium]
MKFIVKKIIVSILTLAFFLVPFNGKFFYSATEKELTQTAIAQTVSISDIKIEQTTDSTISFSIKLLNVDANKTLTVSIHKSKPTLDKPLTEETIRTTQKEVSAALEQKVSVTFQKSGTHPIDNSTTYYISALFQNTKQKSWAYASFVGGSVGSTISEVETIASTDPGENGEGDFEEITGGCGFFSGGKGFAACFAWIFYLIFVVASKIATLCAMFLDFFVYYSTSSGAYSNGFISKGWGTIRDIANMFFIVTLIFVGVKTVLNLNVSDNKKLLGMVVVIALTINFSLFLTRVVVDASNILARSFYTSIKATNASGDPSVGSAGEKRISEGLVAQFNPHNIIRTSADYDKSGAGGYIFIVLFLTVIILYTGYVFMSVAVFFLTRVISIWIAMIFSPIAFVSVALPFDIPKMSFGHWWNDLIKNAMMAPVFVFFLYIIVMLSGELNAIISYQEPTSAAEWVEQLMAKVIPFLIIMGLLQKAKSVTADYAGEIGAMAQKAVGTVGTVAGGLALGGVAGLAAKGLSSTVGAMSSKIANSEGLKDASKKKGIQGFMSKKLLNASDKLSGSSFDIRKSPINSLVAKTGIDMNKSSMIGLGTNKTEGGYKGSMERKDKKQSEKEKREEERLKTNLTDTQVQAKYGADGITTAAELNKRRIQEYRDNIGKGGLMHSLAYSAYEKKSEWRGEGLSPTELNLKAEQAVKTIKIGVGVAVGTVLGAGVGGVIAAGVGAVSGGVVGLKAGKPSAEYERLAAKRRGENKKEEDADVKDKETLVKLDEKKESIERIQNEINDRPRNAGENLKEYVKRQLAELEREVDTVKETEKFAREQRMKLEAKLPTLTGTELTNAQTQIATYQTQENTAKRRAPTLIEDLEKFKITKDADDNLTNIHNQKLSVNDRIKNRFTKK